MSTDKSDTNIEAGASNVVCANCGKAEIDDIKLKDCDKCDLARYCGDECKQNHREIHEATCKERAAELRDELLFKQPESSHLGDCPICFLPMPLESEINLQSCCCKLICFGCFFENASNEEEHELEFKCPFCRKPAAKTNKEHKKNYEKRAEANDPAALRHLGESHKKKGDYDSAFGYLSKAAELGDAISHYYLSLMYQEGKGVEEDEGKEIYHLEEAAIAGDPNARCKLGAYEWKSSRRFERAILHWIIAANLGHDRSLNVLKKLYKDTGLVSKDFLAAALRAHQTAVDATKSPQREAAANAISSYTLQHGNLR